MNLNLVLWVFAAVLAVATLGAGLLKLSTPKAALVEKGMGWAADYSASSVRGIGALEVLGGVGLILPGLLHIEVVLVPVAAVGVALVMAAAVVVHVRRKEIPGALPALVLLILAVLVAWGRFGPAAF